MVELASEIFEGHVGERFDLVPGDGEPFAATLSSCDLTPVGNPADWVERVGRVPFSLLFHAEPGPAAPQQIFELRHAQLGSFSLFLVPLGPDDQGLRYEAVIG
ncbi:MAG: hypothetical protein QOH62_3519 [Solirubrobacteraceae bacterium]|jgi:hypothetical protein|nr:hypothetical protein [Solirubrobacteraceae bacterium]